MGIITDPKSLTLSAERLDWVIKMLKNEIGGPSWEYDRVAKLHWIASDALAIQLELSTERKEYVIHTW